MIEFFHTLAIKALRAAAWVNGAVLFINSV